MRMLRLKGISAFLFVVLMLAVVVGGCTNGDTTTSANATASTAATSTDATTSASTSTSEGEPTSFTLVGFPTGNTMDPWKAQVSQFVEQAVYDTLFHIDENGEPVPWLATSFTYTDPTTLVLKLRTDVKFADGTVFDASVVKANLEYGKTAVPSNFAALPYLSSIESITVVDAETVSIKLVQPNPDLPYGFTQQAGWMVNPAALADPDSLTFGAFGTGAYLLDDAKTIANDTYTFKKNPDYWAGDAWQRFDTLVVKLIADPVATGNAAASGEVQYVMVFPGTTIPGWEITTGSATAFQGLVIMDLKGVICEPLADVRVRQAMNYAIDREAILNAVQGGAGVVNASTPFGPDSNGYSSELDSYYTYDPAKAKQLLADAGYPDGFTVKVLNNPQWDQLAQAIAGYEREIGINLEISNHGNDFVQASQSGDWAIMVGLSSVVGLPFSDVTNWMTPAAPFNPQKNSDAKIDSLLAEASLASGDVQTSIYRELSLYAAEQAWFVVPSLSSQLHAHDPAVVSVTEPKRAGEPMLYMLVPAAK